MRFLGFVIILWSTAGFAPLEENEIVHRLRVHQLSTLSISGKTNVNKYQCAIPGYKGTDTLYLTAKRGKGAYFNRGKVKLQASEFDCGMKVMTKDFVKTIKAGEYPFITIEFISFERMPQYEMSEEKFGGRLNIMLTNVSKPFEVRCGIVKENDGFIHLRGSHKMKFSDFNLEPPSRMLGAIKVAEHIAVDFHLVLEQLH